jgi:hypothetical protein
MSEILTNDYTVLKNLEKYKIIELKNPLQKDSDFKTIDLRITNQFKEYLKQTLKNPLFSEINQSYFYQYLQSTRPPTVTENDWSNGLFNLCLIRKYLDLTNQTTDETTLQILGLGWEIMKAIIEGKPTPENTFYYQIPKQKDMR